jgi:hypothetical protein
MGPKKGSHGKKEAKNFQRAYHYSDAVAQRERELGTGGDAEVLVGRPTQRPVHLLALLTLTGLGGIVGEGGHEEGLLLCDDRGRSCRGYRPKR